MVILYSTGCPKCNVLKAKLKASNIEYAEVSDVAAILKEGIDTVPVLEADGIKLDFMAANEWIKNRSTSNEHPN